MYRSGVDGQVVCGHSEPRRDTVDPALNLSNRSLRSIPRRAIVVSSSYPLKKSPASAILLLLFVFVLLLLSSCPLLPAEKDGRG